MKIVKLWPGAQGSLAEPFSTTQKEIPFTAAKAAIRATASPADANSTQT